MSLVRILKILVIILLVALTIPVSTEAVQNYPSSIAGFPVVFVKTNANSVNLEKGAVVLVLYSSETTLEATNKKLEENGLNKILLPSNYSLEIFGGGDFTPDVYKTNQSASQETMKKYGIPTLKIAETKPTTTKINNLTDWGRTFSCYQNNDVGTQQLRGTQVTLTAPTIGNSQYQWSAFLINGVTNSRPAGKERGWGLQAGLLFSGGNGWVIYSDDTHNLVAQSFNMTYTAGHNYKFYLLHPSSNYWSMSALNINTNAYASHIEYTFCGSLLAQDPDWTNSVWFENANYDQTPPWYQGFSWDLSASNAQDYDTSGSWGSWSSGQVHIHNRYLTDLSNNGPTISGNLLYGYTAYWHVEEIPTLND